MYRCFRDLPLATSACFGHVLLVDVRGDVTDGLHNGDRMQKRCRTRDDDNDFSSRQRRRRPPSRASTEYRRHDDRVTVRQTGDLIVARIRTTWCRASIAVENGDRWWHRLFVSGIPTGSQVIRQGALFLQSPSALSFVIVSGTRMNSNGRPRQK